MRPGALMWVGFLTALACAAGLVMTGANGSLIVMMFAAGAVFGKGYGVWEERGGG